MSVQRRPAVFIYEHLKKKFFNDIHYLDVYIYVFNLIVQRFEPQGSRFINVLYYYHYYYYCDASVV